MLADNNAQLAGTTTSTDFIVHISVLLVSPLSFLCSPTAHPRKQRAGAIVPGQLFL